MNPVKHFFLSLLGLTTPLVARPADSLYTPGATERVAVRPSLGTLIRFPHAVSTSTSMQNFTLEPVGTDFMTFEARAARSTAAAEDVTVLFQNGETLNLRLFAAEQANSFHQFVKAQGARKSTAFSRYTDVLVALRKGTPPSTFKEVPLPEDARRLKLLNAPVRLELMGQFSSSDMTALVLRVTNTTRSAITLSEADFALGEPDRLRAGSLASHTLEPCPIIGTDEACQTTLTLVAEGQGFVPALVRVQPKTAAAERGAP